MFRATNNSHQRSSTWAANMQNPDASALVTIPLPSSQNVNTVVGDQLSNPSVEMSSVNHNLLNKQRKKMAATLRTKKQRPIQSDAE